MLVAEVLVGLATDTTVYLSRRGGGLQVNTLTFTIALPIPHDTLGSQGALCFLYMHFAEPRRVCLQRETVVNARDRDRKRETVITTRERDVAIDVSVHHTPLSE